MEEEQLDRVGSMEKENEAKKAKTTAMTTSATDLCSVCKGPCKMDSFALPTVQNCSSSLGHHAFLSVVEFERAGHLSATQQIIEKADMVVQFQREKLAEQGRTLQEDAISEHQQQCNQQILLADMHPKESFEYKWAQDLAKKDVNDFLNGKPSKILAIQEIIDQTCHEVSESAADILVEKINDGKAWMEQMKKDDPRYFANPSVTDFETRVLAVFVHMEMRALFTFQIIMSLIADVGTYPDSLIDHPRIDAELARHLWEDELNEIEQWIERKQIAKYLYGNLFFSNKETRLIPTCKNIKPETKETKLVGNKRATHNEMIQFMDDNKAILQQIWGKFQLPTNSV